MASKIFLLCLLVLCLTVTNIECRGGRGRGGGRHGGGSRRGGFYSGKLFGSSTRRSHSWESSSSSSHHSYPSSSGLSGSGHHSYPSSSSGLSGYGSKYPSAFSGSFPALSGSRSHYRPTSSHQDEANCVLKVKENGREEALKIPCEIVLTFTQDSKKEVPTQPIQVNKTECTTNITNIPVPVTTTSTTTTTTASPFNIPPYTSYTSYKDIMAYIDSLSDMTIGPDGNIIMPSMSTRRPPVPDLTFSPTELISATEPPNNVPVMNVTTETFSVNGSLSYITKTVITNATMVNVTVCTINSTFVDPLTVKGAPVDPSNMECAVEILTKEASLRTVVDCKILMKYGKPKPKPDTGILAPRELLATWLENPLWWV